MSYPIEIPEVDTYNPSFPVEDGFDETMESFMAPSTIWFDAWPSTPRLFRDIVITEKLDGTNAAIQISTAHPAKVPGTNTEHGLIVETTDGVFEIGAQSRNRIIRPEDDNYGFASWVHANATSLIGDLGIGRHFGEWWGSGIQRKYGMDRKVFSLFNTAKWGSALLSTDGLDVVPVLYAGGFSELAIEQVMNNLKVGSIAAQKYGREFIDPEGVIIYHTHANMVFKYTYEDQHKSL